MIILIFLLESRNKVPDIITKTGTAKRDRLSYKLKALKEDDVTKLIYEIPNEDKNIFTSKFKLLNLYDKNGLCPILISLYRTHIQFLHLNSST